MIKKFRNRCALVLCMILALALSLAPAAMALSAEDYAVLNVRFAPVDTPMNDIEFTAYKVADVAIKDGVYQYSLTSPFAASGVDINAVLNGERVNSDENAYKQLRTAFANYINSNSETIKESGDEFCRTVLTGPAVIDTDGTEKEGIAQFTKLSDGLYLVASNYAVRIAGTRYVPIPFLINVPYVDGDVVNNFITVNVKSTAQRPTDPNEPGNPNNPDNPPDNPDNPGNPGNPGGPGGPGGPDDDVLIDILPDDVPLAGMEGPDDLEIPDVDVPLAALPQTGMLWWPVPVMAALGAAMIIFGLFSKRKAARHE